MDGPAAFLNGEWIPAAGAAVPVDDVGFILGVSVAEQLRTFGGKLFRLEDHLARLAHSLEIVGLDPGMGMNEIGAAAKELAARNHRLLDPGDDLRLAVVITPGAHPAYSPPGRRPLNDSTPCSVPLPACPAVQSVTGYPTLLDKPAEAPPDEKRGLNDPTPCRRPGDGATPGNIHPTVCIHTHPLSFHLWAGQYRRGATLRITKVRQVPAACWPPALKCRSRMHYYLADREAAAAEPGARALLLDADGFVTEASTANLLIHRAGEGLISPPPDKILHGISMSAVVDLARGLGIACHWRDLTVDDVASADEAMLTSTSTCIVPAVRLDGRAIGAGRPGKVVADLLAAWSRMVGLDIVAQAERYS